MIKIIYDELLVVFAIHHSYFKKKNVSHINVNFNLDFNLDNVSTLVIFGINLFNQYELLYFYYFIFCLILFQKLSFNLFFILHLVIIPIEK